MRKNILVLCIILSLFLSACAKEIQNPANNEKIEGKNENEEMDEMIIEVNGYEFEVVLEKNKTTEELMKILSNNPLEIEFDDYGGFEKVGALGRSLTRNDSYTETNPGDIVLYNGNNIVVFYGNNAWSYTRIGRIKDCSNLKKALGASSCRMTFKLK